MPPYVSVRDANLPGFKALPPVQFSARMWHVAISVTSGPLVHDLLATECSFDDLSSSLPCPSFSPLFPSYNVPFLSASSSIFFVLCPFRSFPSLPRLFLSASFSPAFFLLVVFLSAPPPFVPHCFVLAYFFFYAVSQFFQLPSFFCPLVCIISLPPRSFLTSTAHFLPARLSAYLFSFTCSVYRCSLILCFCPLFALELSLLSPCSASWRSLCPFCPPSILAYYMILARWGYLSRGGADVYSAANTFAASFQW